MNYYNEFDPKAAAWLQELISAGAIPAGDVDTRSICDVRAEDLGGYSQCHFFAGISGWSHALQLAGWPEDHPVWTGSCPCQPYPTAGKQLGDKDERNLWPVFFNLIRECRPERVIGEQVANAIGHGWLDGISADLEKEGYACGACVLGAHSVGAPHIRKRLYWLADVQQPRLERHAGNGHHWHQPGRNGADSDGSTSESGGAGRVGHTSSLRQSQHMQCDRDTFQDSANWNPCRPNPDRPSENSRLGSSTAGGRGELRDAAQSPSGGHVIGAEWSRFDLVHCLDGKSRRIESQSQPMAHGLSHHLDALRNAGASEAQVKAALESFPLTKESLGRAMLLRGYGNAIVPQVAAEFIKVFMDQ